MSEAVTPGPNFDWKREAEHYRYQCDQLRELLREVEEIGDQLDSASSAERDALRAELDALRAERDEAKEHVTCVACGESWSRVTGERFRTEVVDDRNRYRYALDLLAERECDCHWADDGLVQNCGRCVARAALAGGEAKP